MSDLQSLLPPSTTPITTALETAMAEPLVGLERPIGTLWNVDTCPEALLPWLAWAVSVEVWDHTWPEARKRSVIRRSFEVHRLKGTRPAVEAALEAVGSGGQIIEWWEPQAAPGMEPGTFNIRLSIAELLVAGQDIADVLPLLREVVDQAKPVSAHYDIRAFHETNTTLYTGVAATYRLHARNVGGIPPAPVANADAKAGVVPFGRIHVPPVRCERIAA